MKTNVLNADHPEEKLSSLLSAISQPARIQILYILESQESCVCHIESVIGLRQASISQHLMSMRKIGLVNTRRDGRHIFYHLAQPEVITLLQKAAEITGISHELLRSLAISPIPGCSCPQCNPELASKIVCK